MSQNQSTTRRPTRGVRNHNPGNIRHARGTVWQGQAPQQADGEFVTFVSPEMGVRALVRTLLTYYKQHRLRSVRAILNRWAPPIGDRNGSAPGGQYRQNTAAYIDAVCREMSQSTGRQINADQALEIDSRAVMRPLVVAIIAHENAGYRYPAAVIDAGLRRAGIADAPPQPLLASGETQGVLISGTAAAAGGLTILDTFAEAKSQLAPLAASSTLIALILIILTLAGLGWTLWSHWSRRHKGLT